MFSAKDIMDLFYAENRARLAVEDYAGSQAMNMGEHAINNYMHGVPPDVWIPPSIKQVKTAHKHAIKDSMDSDGYELVIGILEDALEEYNNYLASRTN